MPPSSAAAPDAALAPTSRRSRRGLLAVVVAAIAAAIGPVGPASAAPVVGSSVDAAPSDSGIQSPRAALADDGALTVVWRRFNAGADTIRAATRPAGQSEFEAPETISSPGWMYEPQVAIDGSGATVVVWQHWNGGTSTIEAARRAPGGGAFSAPVTISTPGEGADHQDMAVSPDGDVTVAWPSWNGSAYTVQTATLTSGSSTFSAPETIVAADVSRPVHVGIGPSGTTTLAWSTGTDIQTATRAAGAPSFSAAVTIPETAPVVSLPRVVEGADGATTVVWRRSEGNYVVRAARRAPGAGSYSPSVDLSAPGQDAGTALAAEDASGALVVVWRRSDGTSERVQAVTRPAGSSAFSAPQDVSPAGADAFSYDLAADGSGTILTWVRTDGATAVLQASARPAGSTSFPAPVDVASSSSGSSVGHIRLRAGGDGALVWQSPGGSGSTIRVADLDGAASALGGVSLDPTAVAGQPVAMSMEVAADAWAALAPAPIWDFGDGSPATAGAEVAHVYAAAGTYPVTIARSNALGRPSSFTIHLTVAEAPAPSTPAPPASGPPVTPSPAPRTVPLSARMRLARSSGRLVVRVSGRAGAAEARRRVLVERMAGRRVVRVCALRVSARGTFAGRCRLGRVVRGQRPSMRLRVRLPAATGVRGARTKAVLLRS